MVRSDQRAAAGAYRVRPGGLGGLRAVAASVVVAAGLVACGGGDDDAGGGGIGAAAGGGTSTTGGGNGSVATATPTDPTTTTTTATTEPVAELPPPDFPDSAAPPTTAPGTEPLEIPEGPMFGEFPVDVEPGGFVDVPVALRQGQEITILSNADDGVFTHISIYAPGGEVVGQWDGGEPQVINGWSFDAADPLPADGVYVIRVQHRSGRDEPFLIRFYGEA